jgi:hypothetical protein
MRSRTFFERVVVAVAGVDEGPDPGRSGAVEDDRDLVAGFLELLCRHERVGNAADSFAAFGAGEDDECCSRHSDSSFLSGARLEGLMGGSGSPGRRI